MLVVITEQTKGTYRHGQVFISPGTLTDDVGIQWGSLFLLFVNK